MTDRRNMLLMELEKLQTRRRDAVEAYVSTGDRNCWRKVRDASQAIADMLRELEGMRRSAARAADVRPPQAALPH
jgi:hypothetical protein